MGLFLPSMRTAREQSKQLVCRKNLTSMWRGVVLYSVEYNDRLPYIEHIKDDIDPFDQRYPTKVGNVLGGYVDRGSFVCPSAVSGYPETDPKSRRKWKLTYDFSTADRVGDPLPYDDAADAYTGSAKDPAVANEYHFDGRPTRMLTAKPQMSIGDEESGDEDKSPGEGKAEIIWNVAVPLISDTLAENRPGDKAAGRPVYPHRGVVRRYVDVYRSLATTSDPRVITNRRPGYFHLYADRDQPEVFLTRYSPDTDFDD